MSVSLAIKRLWTRLMLKGVHYGDRHHQLELLYRVEDPWGLGSARERFRFEETNRLILREFGHVDSLFELGSGEGHQSQYLAHVCENLYGCDVSAQAIERAQSRCPKATFSVGAFPDALAGHARSYNLVVACEVLYYIKDLPGALREMSRIGDACLVTYYQSQRQTLDEAMDVLAPKTRTLITLGDDSWTVAWWRNG